MQGYWYSVKENFKFERKELKSILWTVLAFALIQALVQPGVKFQITAAIYRFLLFFVFVWVAMFLHVSLQKLVAIKLGYKATYSHWTNGLFISLFLAIMFYPIFGGLYTNSSFFVTAFLIIFPGSVMIEHIPKLRLGKFRFGLNLKDVARVSVAGPISHIIMVMLAGIIYYASGKNEIVFSFIIVNIILAFFSMLPIPKIDIPKKMDMASDGLGLLFYSRALYMWVFLVMMIYLGLILIASIFSFILAFILGSIVVFVFNAVMKQSN